MPIPRPARSSAKVLSLVIASRAWMSAELFNSTGGIGCGQLGDDGLIEGDRILDARVVGSGEHDCSEVGRGRFGVQAQNKADVPEAFEVVHPLVYDPRGELVERVGIRGLPERRRDACVLTFDETARLLDRDEIG